MKLKLLREMTWSGIESLTEQTSNGKVMYLEGPFLMSNATNRNGRFYSRSVMEAAVDRYQKEFIDQNRALGELTHPDYPMPNVKTACLKIESLKWQGDNVIGKARVLNNPDGQQIKALMEAGFNMGVSSRGLGDVKKRGDLNEVHNFFLNAIDAVDHPSGQVCYVNALSESVNWIEKDGIWIQESAQGEVVKLEDFLESFREHLSKLKMR